LDFFSNAREQRKDGCVNVIILLAGCDVNNEAKIFRLPSPDSNLPSKAKTVECNLYQKSKLMVLEREIE